jgi:biotin synthase
LVGGIIIALFSMHLPGFVMSSAANGMPSSLAPQQSDIRHEWSRQEVEALFALPFNDLLFRAQTVHRSHFDPNQVQVSTLLSIKTGACPEDCAYCPQSTRYDTGLEVEKLMEVEKVLEQARLARESGATRFCMGAAWRSPKQRDMPHVVALVMGLRDLGV